MRRLLGIVATVALLAIVCAATNPTALAQKDKDKDKSTKKSGPGTVEIGEGKDGKFRLTIRDADGKFLALSAPHATEKEARAAIEELRDALNKAKVTVKKAEKTDKKEKEKKEK
jgi:predicted aconitase